MSRGRTPVSKPGEDGKVVHKFSVEHDWNAPEYAVRLNTGSGVFTVTVSPRVKFTDTALPGVIEQAKLHLQGVHKIKWAPVILVSHESRDRNRPDLDHDLSLSYERYYTGSTKQSGVQWREWEPIDQSSESLDAVEGKPGGLTRVGYIGGEVVKIPYTAEDWTALRTISKMIYKLDEQIGRIVTKKKLLPFLRDVRENGAKLLVGGGSS